MFGMDIRFTSQNVLLDTLRHLFVPLYLLILSNFLQNLNIIL